MKTRIALAFALLLAILLPRLAFAQCVGAGGIPFNCLAGNTPQSGDYVLGGSNTTPQAGHTVRWTWAQVFAAFGGGNITGSGTPGQLALWATSSSLGSIPTSSITSVGTLSSGAIGSGFTAIPNSALANSTISGIALGFSLDALTFGTHLTGSSYNGSANVTIATDATNADTASTIVARDASGNFSAGTISASLTGGASLDLPLAGGTLTGKLITAASATGGAGFNLPQGTAPTSPANGDLWSTSSGVFARINGSNIGPFAAGGTVTTTGSPASGNLAAFSGDTSITSGNLSGDCATSGTLAVTCTKFNGKATAPTTLSATGSPAIIFTPDGSSYNYNITLTTACPCTLANPSVAMNAGDAGQITVKQSSTGSNTIGTYGSYYEAPGGTITYSAGDSAQDTLSYYALDSTHILLAPSLDFLTVCSAVSPPSGGVYDSTSLSGSTTTGGTLTLTNSASPDCATNGSTFVEDTSTGNHSIVVSGAEITHTFSSASATITVYVKQGSGTRSVQVLMYDSTFTDYAYIVVLPSACTVTTGPGSSGFPAPSSTQTAIAGGWCKITLTTNPISVSGVYAYLESYNGSNSYAGDGASSLIYWGFGLTSP